jgi:4-oxalocrotonate tautomerase
MPLVTIRFAQGRPVERNGALTKAVTDAVAENLDVKSEAVILIIDEYGGEDWTIGGVLHSDKTASGRGCPAPLRSVCRGYSPTFPCRIARLNSDKGV